MVQLGSHGMDLARSKPGQCSLSDSATDGSARKPSLLRNGMVSGIAALIGRLTFSRSSKSVEPARDRAGRFISLQHRDAIETARAMRASLPDKKWKYDL